MFQVSNAHLQEDIVVLTLAAYRQATRTLTESDGTICCLYTTIPPEDEHLMLETCTTCTGE